MMWMDDHSRVNVYGLFLNELSLFPVAFAINHQSERMLLLQGPYCFLIWTSCPGGRGNLECPKQTSSTFVAICESAKPTKPTITLVIEISRDHGLSALWNLVVIGSCLCPILNHDLNVEGMVGDSVCILFPKPVMIVLALLTSYHRYYAVEKSSAIPLTDQTLSWATAHNFICGNAQGTADPHNIWYASMWLSQAGDYSVGIVNCDRLPKYKSTEQAINKTWLDWWRLDPRILL